ncbi:MAG: TonB-dependent siderophore receptor [Nostoc sp.]|uniref:TonB-dependent siderophore receptor n=1 Tax=Nostoc sp. TaxID=1180 RepID=UPI002FFC40A9
MNKQQFSACFSLIAVSVLVAFPARADVVQVTNVELVQADTHVKVILKTTSKTLPQVFTTRSKKIFIADISNTQLRLASGNEFRVLNLKPGIARVAVSQLTANIVRVTVIGDTEVPAAVVAQSNGYLVVILTSSVSTTQKLTPTSTPTPEVTPTDTLPSERTQPPSTPEQSPIPIPSPQRTPPQSMKTQLPIELFVTAPPETGYWVPNASVGTRTDTPIRDIPQSIQVAPRQVIEDQQDLTIQEVLRNFGVLPGNGLIKGDTFTIRGFQTNNTLRNGLKDGGSANSIQNEITNIERIEILRGADSLLYGQGQPGGTINLVTKQPLSEPYVSAKLTGGSYNLVRSALNISGPLSADNKLLYRLNTSYSYQESFSDFYKKTNFFIAPILTWQLSQNTKLTLEAEYQNLFLRDTALPAVGTVLPNPNGKIPLNRYVGEPKDFDNTQTTRVGYQFEHRFSKNWSLRNAFRASFVSYNQRKAFADYLQSDDRTLERSTQESVKPIVLNTYILDTNIVGKFNTGGIQHELLLGFDLYRDIQASNFVFRDNLPLDLFNPVYGQPLGSISGRFNQKIKNDALGIYAEDKITLFNNLKLLLGGRFSFVESENTNSDSISRQPDSAFSPKVGIVYQPIKPVSFYASYIRSFDPTIGFNADGNAFQPERGTQYEVGIKTDLLDNRLSATLALYQITRSNVLTTDPNNIDFSVQTGEERSRGIEFDIKGEILPGWQVIVSYTYTDARITNDNVFPVGNRLVNTPFDNASLWTTYRFSQGSLQGLGFGFGLFYVGERFGDIDNTFSLPSYLRTDAAIYYRGNNFQAAVNFKNLFDVRYFENSTSQLRVLPGDPFTVGVTVQWQF